MRETRLSNLLQGGALSLLAWILLSSTPSRTISGVVTYSNQAPFPGATVFIPGMQIETVTAADGSFTLSGLEVSEVTLVVHAVHHGRRQRLAVTTIGADLETPGRPQHLKIQVTAEDPANTRTIKGTVVDRTTGVPMAAVAVNVVGTSSLVFSETDGSFAIYDVAAGAAKLSIEAPEYETSVVDMPANVDNISIRLALAKVEQIVIPSWEPVPRYK
jgi:Carboxypeptidase regulatory-like domain